MEIGALMRGLGPVGLESYKQFTAQETPDAGGFKAALNQSIAEVNQLLNQADQKNVDLVTGKTENLHETMISFEKAETALKFMVQVRNKAIEAYQEIIRMQV